MYLPRVKHKFSRFIQWAFVPFSFVSAVSIYDFKSLFRFLKNYWWLGWSLAFVLYLAYLISSQFFNLRIRPRNSADIRILGERLSSWHMESKLAVTLSNGLNFKALPEWFIDEIEERERAWSRDRRIIKDKTLSEMFNKLVVASVALTDFARTEMETMESANGFLKIPAQLNVADYERYAFAVAESSKLTNDFREALLSLQAKLNLSNGW